MSKPLTRVMKIGLSNCKHLKLDPNDYLYRANTRDRIELVHKQTKESITLNKEEYNLRF